MLGGLAIDKFNQLRTRRILDADIALIGTKPGDFGIDLVELTQSLDPLINRSPIFLTRIGVRVQTAG